MVRKLSVARLLAAPLLALPLAAAAYITDITVTRVQPFADGASFGDAGACERVSGTARGELDPFDVRNRGIVNLDKAPRNSGGNVEYTVAWDMLRPVRGGNRKLLFDVTNRGQKFVLNWVCDELVLGTRGPVAQDFTLAFDALTQFKDDARLTVRRKEAGPRVPQSGRYLRDHIAQGFNQDEGKRKVFDGVLAHILGVGRVFLNAEFGQPARTNTHHEDHLYSENAFPFSAARMADPVTGATGALLRGDAFDPLLIEVNTSTEYWQNSASLLHTDPLGTRDVELPAGARAHLVAGLHPRLIHSRLRPRQRRHELSHWRGV